MSNRFCVLLPKTGYSIISELVSRELFKVSNLSGILKPLKRKTATPSRGGRCFRVENVAFSETPHFPPQKSCFNETSAFGFEHVRF